MDIKSNKLPFSFSGWMFILSLCSVLLVACATETRSIRLDESLTYYASSIRWGDFEGATKFYKEKKSWNDIDFSKFKTIKVTSYDAKSRLISKDGKMLSQSVRILYYDTNVGKELELKDRQVWVYDKDQEVWMLTSPFPRF